MLIEATVGNLFSFGDPQTLSMVADDDYNDKLHYVMEVDTTPPLKLLRWATLLGANASGKSNFLKALALLKAMVDNTGRLNSDSKVSDAFTHLESSLKAYLPFNTKEKKTQPSAISIIYSYQQHCYKFEVSFDADKIHDEALWLLIDDNDEKLIYNRDNAETSFFDHEDILAIKAHKTVFSSQLAYSRMLNNLNLNDYEYTHFLSLGHWLNNFICPDPQILFSDSQLLSLLLMNELNETKKTNLMQYIKQADFSITDYHLNHSRGGYNLQDIMIIHDGLERLPMASQSTGTFKILPLVHLILSLPPNSVLCVDELDTHLHPALFVHFVQDVCLKRNIQLIFTCHSPYVLDEDGLDPRLDQIWRVEKDRSTLMSQLGCFSEFRGLPTDAEGKLKKFDVKYAYLEGVFGGVPRIDEG